MNTQLITSSARDVYSKIDNPMTAMIEMGKLFHQSGIMGVASPGDGAVVALTCICEGITPMEFARTYHIIKGRPSMRADMMSAKFRGAGGKVNWKNLGDDGKLAEAEFVYDGQTQTIKYTIEDAKAVVGDKLDTPDSNWKKDRGAMLRARLITKAVRIMAPEIIAGVYTPDEIEESSPTSSEPAKPKKAPKDRLKELEEQTITVTSDPVPETQAPAEDAIIDAVTEEAPFETNETESIAAPADATPADDDLPTTNELLTELVKLGSKIPSPSGTGGMTLAEVAQVVCTAAKVAKPNMATRKQVRTLIARFRSTLGPK